MGDFEEQLRDSLKNVNEKIFSIWLIPLNGMNYVYLRKVESAEHHQLTILV